MTMLKKIEKEKQRLARCEKSLVLEKLKKRKADTRHKIELGGLVIKSGMIAYNKEIILGALMHAFQHLENDKAYISIFESMGRQGFLSE